MIKPIRSEKEYKTALARIYELIQSELKVNSDEFNELELLSILVENYESKHFPIIFQV
jgi:HTH-type transcriptional regulator/antitoxin HigA